MAGYNPKKAAAYNQLRQQGLSEEQAARQAGISAAEDQFYEVNEVGSNNPKDASYNPNRGKMGPPVSGANAAEYNKAIASGKTEEQAYAELQARKAEAKASRLADREEDADETFERSPVAINEKTPPGGKVTTINYTTDSTETVSGGGTETRINRREPNSQSQALQPAIDAKAAEVDQFIKDNPSNLVRKRRGLPLLTPEENEARADKLRTLEDQQSQLRNQQIDAETPVATPVITTPNTTTTTRTVTTAAASTNGPVNPETDQKLSQENESQLDATTSAANATTLRDPTGVLAAEDAAIAEQAAAQGDANAFAGISPVQDPTGVLAAEDAALAEQAAAQGDADAFANAGTIRDPGGVLAAEDEALRQEEIDRSDAEAFEGRGTEPEPVGAEQLGNDYGFTSEETEGAEPTPLGAEPDTTAAFKALVKSQGTLQSRYKQPGNGDWRVRLSLAPYSDYLYNATGAGILRPLTATNGVIFPYTPNISTTYSADYEKYNLIHSNYRGLFYKSSSVGDLQIRGTFTAQDTREAAYLLAVIHFFRSVTKMFYGQDAERGTPPPLVYLSGYGDQQFSNHPCVVGQFNYSLPNEVDYIRTNGPNNFGPNMSNRQTPRTTSPGGINFSGAIRLANALLNKGAMPQLPAQNALSSAVNNTNECTYVPTKMEIDITLIPVQTRSQVSKQFSLKEFANGNLLKKGFW